MSAMSDKKRVLIVDDVQENCAILRKLLVDYVRLVALNGMQALKIATSDPQPDLILLDIMMPEMDGFEVCRRLQADEKTRHIPIIFLSAQTTVEAETKGLELGAVDYITKPFSPEVVKVRVKNHLALKTAFEDLRSAHYALAQQNQALIAADQLRCHVEQITRHDLKSPLNGILGCVDLLQSRSNLSHEGQVEFFGYIKESALSMRHMVNQSFDILKMEAGTYPLVAKKLNILPLIRRVFLDVRQQIESKALVPILKLSGRSSGNKEPFWVYAEEELCFSLLSNLMKNAVEASPAEKSLRVSLSEGEQAIIKIHNFGSVPEEIRENFFEKYVTSGKTTGTGLGTYSARLMVEVQQGSIAMVSSEAEGTTLTVCLPLTQPDTTT